MTRTAWPASPANIVLGRDSGKQSLRPHVHIVVTQVDGPEVMLHGPTAYSASLRGEILVLVTAIEHDGM